MVLTGYVSDGDRAALTAGATAVAYPSRYEGFGLPVLEAMAAGVPVLTSSVSSLPEVAGDAAVLVDPTDVSSIADGLQRLLADDALRERLSRGRAGARRDVHVAGDGEEDRERPARGRRGLSCTGRTEQR